MPTEAQLQYWKSLKGKTSPNKGREMSDEQKAKLSLAHKGKKLSDEHKASLSAANKGRRPYEMTDVIRAKIKANHVSWNKGNRTPRKSQKVDNPDITTRFAQNHTPWNTGMKMSKEHREVLSQAHIGIPNKAKGIPRPNKRGSNHPLWKGGAHTQRHIEMGRVEYKNWREAVFQRDDYTCQHCKVRGGYLEADHIKPWVSHPKLRYDILNGRTLCVKCHRATPTWGRRVALRQF